MYNARTARCEIAIWNPLLDPHIKQKFAEIVILTLYNKPPDVSHTHLTHILSTTSITMLPKRARATPLWFASSIEALRDSIDHRNKVFDFFHKSPTPINKVKKERNKSLTERACKGHRVLSGYAAL